jgi:hypothetical protein
MARLGWLVISLVIMLIAIAGLLFHSFIAPLPVWLVRTVGILVLLSILCVAYHVARLLIERKNQGLKLG